ncbi:MAG TPA: Uma2 family endonuclease [Candidatus Acidoferrum sp.]|nr:Uma2 family endonuclease [Candidatus Acidoferrum sp.]
MGAVRTLLTMDEFLALPELPAGKRELLRGELIDLPPAKFRHDKIAHRLFRRLETAAGASGTKGEVYMEIGYQLSLRHWLQPDVSLTHPDQPVNEYLQGAPLLAVEIVSQGNTAEQIELKIEAYFAFGAAEVWVLYPESRHLWVYAAEISAQRHSGVFISHLFNGERIDLDEIFAD